MSLLERLSVSRQVWFMFGALGLVLAAIGAWLFFSLRGIEHRRQTQLAGNLHRLTIIDEVSKNVALSQNALFRHVLVTDPAAQDGCEKMIRELDALNGRRLAAYEIATDQATEIQLLAKVALARKEYLARTEELLVLSRARRLAEVAEVALARQMPAGAAYEAAADALSAEAEKREREFRMATTDYITRSRNVGDALLGLAILITLGTGFVVAGIAGQLKGDRRALQIEVAERQRAEGAVRLSREKLQQQKNELRVLFDMMPAMICFKDTENRILRVNQRLADTFGRSIEELEGKLTLEVDPQGAAKFYTDDLEVIRSGTPRLGIIETVRNREGQEVWIQTDRVPVYDENSQVSGIVVMIQDITNRREAEVQLRFNEQRYRTLVEATTAIVWDMPASGEFEIEQPRWTAFTGQSFDECRGLGWLTAIHPDDRAKTARIWSSAVTRRSIYELEQRVRARDHTYHDMLVRAVPILAEDGTIRQWIGVHTDITERKRAEESLRLLGSAVEQSKEAIMITDAELDSPGPRILFVNPSFTQMTGYTAAEAIGQSPRMLQGPQTDKNVLHRLREELRRGEAFSGEAINYRKDGEEFNLEWQIAPIRQINGAITHFVALQRDITERRRLESQLVQSQRMETVGKLAGGVAHEFNSILTAIIGQSELLLSDLPAGSPLAENATEISRAAVRAATLTRQLLAYSRKQILQPEILDLNAVLTGMESTLRHLLGHGADLRIVAAAGLKAVRADAGQIEQVIMNLALNAGDAMPNGGKFTLETANVFFDEESVSRYPELQAGDYVMLAVTDTGTGMSAEVKARVFEPFFTTKGIGQGTGLGLSTCYGIAKQSGGHISVYSELGRGTTFKIYLPQIAEEVARPAPRLGSLDLPRGTETILLVEDDPALREMAAALLRRLGYTVLAAAHGIEALSLRQQRDIGHIDLLFTDVVMPHMNGKELAERVRSLSPHTRILFTSAYTENAIVHQGVLDPGVALLQKPFTPSALANKLREVLDSSVTPTVDPASELSLS